MSEPAPDIDLDFLRSASHRSMAGHLSGPFTGGAKDTPLALGADGRAVVDRVTRHPLVVVAPRADVGPAGFQIAFQVITGADAPVTGAPVVIRFAPFTEAGAFLPVYHPDPLAPGAGEAPPFTVVLAGAGSGAPDVPLAELAELIELRLIEGVMGRLLYVLGAEKQRIRRQAQELFAIRRLEHASGDALDRLGAELGVPRFEDRLSWNAELVQPDSVSAREPDADYRRRLALYRPLLMATRRRVLAQLNGPGTSGPNTGPLAGLGLTERFTVGEDNTEFAVGIRLVGPRRQAFLDHLRHVHLLAPEQPVPGHRLLPNHERDRQEALLARLRAGFDVPAGAYLAPGLARALDRVGRCRAALQVTRRWRVLRAQDDGGGSRYELGLGIDVEIPPAEELTLLAQNLSAGQIAPGTDLEIQQLLASLQPVPPEDDPIGRWLLAGCGLRTVHALPGSRYYLAQVPIHGMELNVFGGTPQGMEARLHAPGDVGLDAFLFHSLRDAEADVAAQGLPAWTRLSAADTQTAWAKAVVPPQAVIDVFAAAGLRTPTHERDLGRAVTALAEVPGEMTMTLALDAILASAILAGKAEAVSMLRQMVASFERHQLVSVLPLATSAAGVLLVVGAVALPGGAAVLNTRRQGFRWYMLPVAGAPGTLAHSVGSRNRYEPPGEPGLAAAVAVALVRRNQEDPRGRVLPYEVRLGLPPGVMLDLAQYELLMNLLAHVAPAGVAFDTRILRQRHVDPAGQGTAVPLVGPLARSFRTFRQRRHPGERDIDTVK